MVQNANISHPCHIQFTVDVEVVSSPSPTIDLGVVLKVLRLVENMEGVTEVGGGASVSNISPSLRSLSVHKTSDGGHSTDPTIPLICQHNHSIKCLFLLKLKA